LKLYKYDENDGSAFREALIDYLKTSGKKIPSSLIRGEPPEISKGKHGKPYFSGAELGAVLFSRSHSNGCEIVCFSDGKVGVDCEDTFARDGRNPDFEKVARRFFSLDEQEYIAYGDPGAKDRFYEVWTAKEAYMKYTGNGFSEGFQSFSVFDLKDAEIKTERLKDAPHIVYSICCGRGEDMGSDSFEAPQGRSEQQREHRDGIHG
jgi:phosphopantetheine--protein transferase-like protein